MQRDGSRLLIFNLPNCFTYMPIYALDEGRIYTVMAVNLPLRSSDLRIWTVVRCAHIETTGQDSLGAWEQSFSSAEVVREGFWERVELETGRQKAFLQVRVSGKITAKKCANLEVELRQEKQGDNAAGQLMGQRTRMIRPKTVMVALE